MRSVHQYLLWSILFEYAAGGFPDGLNLLADSINLHETAAAATVIACSEMSSNINPVAAATEIDEAMDMTVSPMSEVSRSSHQARLVSGATGHARSNRSEPRMTATEYSRRIVLLHQLARAHPTMSRSDMVAEFARLCRTEGIRPMTKRLAVDHIDRLEGIRVSSPAGSTDERMVNGGRLRSVFDQQVQVIRSILVRDPHLPNGNLVEPIRAALTAAHLPLMVERTIKNRLMALRRELDLIQRPKVLLSKEQVALIESLLERKPSTTVEEARAAVLDEFGGMPLRFDRIRRVFLKWRHARAMRGRSRPRKTR